MLFPLEKTKGDNMIHFGEIETVMLPEMQIAVFEDEPEPVTDAMANTWLIKNHKGRGNSKNCLIYRRYMAIPENLAVASEENIQQFRGGRFARMVITDPFSSPDFPLGWGKILQWTFENGIKNRLGCTSPDDIFISFFSNDESPCIEEVYTKDGITYMGLFLPIM